MTINIVQGDITEMSVDVIVNAANPSLLGGGGVDGAIHRAAGPWLLKECKQWVADNGELPTGDVAITPAFALRAQYVFHTVGPIYWQHSEKEAATLLRRCYDACLGSAIVLEAKTIAFPSISTGVYGYPIEKAAKEVRDVIDTQKYGDSSLEEVYLVLFSKSDLDVYNKVFGK